MARKVFTSHMAIACSFISSEERRCRYSASFLIFLPKAVEAHKQGMLFPARIRL